MEFCSKRIAQLTIFFVQCSGIIFDLYRKSKRNFQLCNRCLELHVKYYKDYVYRPLITKCCEKIKFWSKISIFFKLFTIVALPIAIHYMTTHRKVLLALYIPGIDSSSYPGYEISTVLHVIYFTNTGVGLSFFELQVLAISFNTSCLGDIVICKMRKADEIKDNLGKELKEIIRLYKDYVNLVNDFSQSYNILITTKFLTAIMNISFALFVIQVVSSVINLKLKYIFISFCF